MKNSLIHRFLKKQLTPEELTILLEKVNRNEESILESMEEDWASFENSESKDWEEKKWNELEPLLNEKIEKEPVKIFRLRPWMQVAAAVVIFTSVWLVYRNQQDPKSEDGFPAMITKTNTTNQPSIVALKDGTKVTLAANSSLSYYENFNKKYRVVHLNGEAFFETDKENKRPFIVISDNITSICRGEEFSISAFDDMEEISVSLTSGEIEIAQNDKLNSEYNKVAVKGCQRYSFNKTSQEFLINQISECEFDENVQSIKSETSEKKIVML